MATSDPVPMAMPTSASASAGASLTPSPAMATTAFPLFREAMSACLSAGVIPPWNSEMPSSLATASTVAGASPEAMMMRMPRAVRSARAWRVFSRILSAREKAPAAWPSTAAKTVTRPCLRCSSTHRAREEMSTPRFCIMSAVPTQTLLPWKVPATPPPGKDWKSSMGDRVSFSSAAFWRKARAMGCSLFCSREAHRASSASIFTLFPVVTLTRDGLPSVRVPVLSITRILTLCMVSRAAASRKRMPREAAFPEATIMDMGVARPSAQGQATIRTATAFTSPCGQDGCGPQNPQAKNVRTAMSTTASTK